MIYFKLLCFIFVLLATNAEKFPNDPITKNSNESKKVSNIEKRCSPCITVNRDQDHGYNRDHDQHNKDSNYFNDDYSDNNHNKDFYNDRRLHGSNNPYQNRIKARFRDKSHQYDSDDIDYWNYNKRPTYSKKLNDRHHKADDILQHNFYSTSNEKYSSGAWRSNTHELNDNERPYESLYKSRTRFPVDDFDNQYPINNQHNAYRGNGYDNLNEFSNNNYDRKFRYKNTFPTTPSNDFRKNQKPLNHDIYDKNYQKGSNNWKINTGRKSQIADCLNGYTSNYNDADESYRHQSKFRNQDSQQPQQQPQQISNHHFSPEKNDLKGTSYLHERNSTLIMDSNSSDTTPYIPTTGP